MYINNEPANEDFSVSPCMCVCVLFFGQACNTRPLCRFDRKIIANIFIDNRVVWFKCMVQLWIWAHVAIPKEIRLHVYCTRSESVWPNAMERENKKNIAVIFIRHRHYNCMDVSFFLRSILSHSFDANTNRLAVDEWIVICTLTIKHYSICWSWIRFAIIFHLLLGFQRVCCCCFCCSCCLQLQFWVEFNEKERERESIVCRISLLAAYSFRRPLLHIIRCWCDRHS